ncbi:MAG: hypothetical protein H8E21_16540 [Gammaproteobacteria bacterium]|nr:hypothetical protein [Gammaproteobacteria bacterium]MBL7000727.1 hypothetical protein [Gammaproteobacteria bacterium]
MRDKQPRETANDDEVDDDITVILTTGEMMDSLYPPAQAEHKQEKPSNTDKGKLHK